MGNVKKNFGYNLILTFCNYLFPLITYPYVSRVLGVERIGLCNFVDGIVNYFILFSTLGICSYGVREIARCKDNKDRRSYVFSNLIVINVIGTIVASASLVCATLFLEVLQPYRDFLYLGVIKLFFNMFLIEWFFQGMQEFRYITIRSVIIRFFYVISVFAFVQTKDDVVLYYALTVATTIVNAVANWGYSRKYKWLSFRHLRLKIFIIPVLSFGYYRLLTSMYTTFNIVFLGFSSGDTEVGYFSTATKLYSILMGVFTAFTTVMIPKVSELLASGEKELLQDIANRTFFILTILALPLIFFCFFCSGEIILLLSGPGYEGANTPFRIAIFLLLIIGMEQIVIQQFLMASSSNKSILIVSTVGAVIGVSLNFLITPSLGAIGSAISWGISELAVLLTGLKLLRDILGITVDLKTLLKNILWSIVYIIPLTIINMFNYNMWLKLLLSASIIIIVFLFLQKNTINKKLKLVIIKKLGYNKCK